MFFSLSRRQTRLLSSNSTKGDEDPDRDSTKGIIDRIFQAKNAVPSTPPPPVLQPRPLQSRRKKEPYGQVEEWQHSCAAYCTGEFKKSSTVELLLSICVTHYCKSRKPPFFPRSVSISPLALTSLFSHLGVKSFSFFILTLCVSTPL